MGLFGFIAGVGEKAKTKKLEKEKQLLAEPNTVKATITEILTHNICDWEDNPADISGNQILVEQNWTKPVVVYSVDGVTIRSEVGEPGEWKEQGKKSFYKVGEHVIVRYLSDNHYQSEIFCKCVETD